MLLLTVSQTFTHPLSILNAKPFRAALCLDNLPLPVHICAALAFTLPSARFSHQYMTPSAPLFYSFTYSPEFFNCLLLVIFVLLILHFLGRVARSLLLKVETLSHTHFMHASFIHSKSELPLFPRELSGSTLFATVLRPSSWVETREHKPYLFALSIFKADLATLLRQDETSISGGAMISVVVGENVVSLRVIEESTKASAAKLSITTTSCKTSEVVVQLSCMDFSAIAAVQRLLLMRGVRRDPEQVTPWRLQSAWELDDVQSIMGAYRWLRGFT